MPALALDNSFIDYMTSGGIPLSEARDYRLAGCVDPAIPGKQNGMNTKGPTAMLRSAAKIDQAACSSALHNIKLHLSFIGGGEGLTKLGVLIKTYGNMGGKMVLSAAS